MKKIFLLAISIIFIAAGCDVLGGDIFGSPGVKGVFKSEDGGKTFKPFNTIAQKKADLNNLSVSDLVFDSANDEIVYVASTTGLYKSTDKAITWSLVLSNISLRDIDIAGGTQSVIYACGVSEGNGKIIKTVDGGATWIDLYTEPNKSNPVVGVAASKINDKHVFAVLASGEFIRSTDSGSTWTNLYKFEDAPIKMLAEKSGGVYVLTGRKGLFYSNDAGVRWSNISTSLTANLIQGLTSSSVSVSTFYDYTLDDRQAGVVYIATDVGLLRTVNGGNNWSLVKLPYKTAALKIGSIAVSPFDSNKIFVGIGYILMTTTNGGVSWDTKELPTQASIKKIVMDPKSQFTVYLGMADRK